MGAESASRAISDFFTVGREVLKMEQRVHPRTTALPRQILLRTIPTASLSTSPESNTEEPQNDVPLHVPTNDAIFRKIERLDLAGLLKVYNDFFHYLWGRLKPSLYWKGKIVYGKLMSPWLCVNVAFLHGETCNNSINRKY